MGDELDEMNENGEASSSEITDEIATESVEIKEPEIIEGPEEIEEPEIAEEPEEIEEPEIAEGPEEIEEPEIAEEPEEIEEPEIAEEPEEIEEPEIAEEPEEIEGPEVVEEPEEIEEPEIAEEPEEIEEPEIAEEPEEIEGSEIVEEPEEIEEPEIAEEPEEIEEPEIAEEPEEIEGSEIVEEPEEIEEPEIAEEPEEIEEQAVEEVNGVGEEKPSDDYDIEKPTIAPGSESEIQETMSEQQNGSENSDETEIAEEPMDSNEPDDGDNLDGNDQTVITPVSESEIQEAMSELQNESENSDETEIVEEPVNSNEPDDGDNLDGNDQTVITPVTESEIQEAMSEIDNNDISDNEIDSETDTINLLRDYMEEHNYGREDYDTYSQDPEWRRLMQIESPETELPPLTQETIDDILSPYEGKSYDSIAEYYVDHNFGKGDYEVYSQDPEWRRLMEIEHPEIELPPLNSSEVIENARVFDEFESSMMDKNPTYKDYYESGTFYDQGLNEYGFSGTCGPTSQANAINCLLSTNEFTENKVLQIAVDNNLCEMNGAPEDCGGTTTDNFMKLYEKVNEQTGNKLDVQLYEYENALDINEMANRLDNGSVLNVAVDSAVLWGQADNYGMGYREDSYSDHWITITKAERDATGNVVGFNIIDSGGGKSYVDADVCDRMCFGDDNHRVIDPTMIVVSKK